MELQSFIESLDARAAAAAAPPQRPLRAAAPLRRAGRGHGGGHWLRGLRTGAAAERGALERGGWEDGHYRIFDEIMDIM